jgi:hypothetical protein
MKLKNESNPNRTVIPALTEFLTPEVLAKTLRCCVRISSFAASCRTKERCGFPVKRSSFFKRMKAKTPNSRLGGIEVFRDESLSVTVELDAEPVTKCAVNLAFNQRLRARLE